MSMSILKYIQSLADLGCAVAVVALFLYCGYKIIAKFAEPFLANQKQMAEAMSGMKGIVESSLKKDRDDHREIIISTQVVGEELKTLTSCVETLAKDQKQIKQILITSMGNSNDERSGKDQQKEPDQAFDIKALG